MAKVNTNTTITESQALQKEDIADVISNISPDKTPVCALIGTSPVDSSSPQWPIDSYAAPDASNALEPAYKATFNAAGTASMMGNHSQLFGKTASVDDRLQGAKVYGDFNKLAYQMAKKTVELKKDIEKSVLGSTAAVAMADGVPGKLAGFGALIKTNTSGDGVAPSGYNSSTRAVPARTVLGSANRKNISKANIDEVLTKRFDETGEDSLTLTVYMSMKLKNSIKDLYTASSRIDRVTGNGKTVTDTVDIISTNSGDIRLRPHYMMNDHEHVFFIDPSKASLGVVNGFRTYDIAKTGGATEKALDYEVTLKVTDEKSHGAVYGLKA